MAVTQLASGSRLETNDAIAGGFSSSTDSVLGAGAGSLSFKVDSTGDSFSINVTAGMTLTELRSAINEASDNFGVTANIINTGTADGGSKLVFTSEVTGVGNDLKIVNDNDLADLNRVSTTDSTETATYLSVAAGNEAKNAQATIDGLLVESSTNEFKNTIQNVSFDVKNLSSLEADGITFKESILNIGNDTEGLDKKIRDFVDNYNSLSKEIATLTRYGQSDLEEDGALAGDFMVRSIQQGIANIVGDSVDGSSLGGLFAIGVELNDDGELEISAADNFGLGSGEERLKEALEDNFDEISALFADDEDGVAARLYDYVKEYTTFSGLLTTRERAVNDQKDQLASEREQFELRMLGFEQVLRDKYLNLDQTVARLNQTGSALFAALGG